ncbi:MAG: helix-turn-helix domain-containing protein [Nanoarchaeota archaeon]
MEKKFILMSLDDEKSKNIADILGNKTCKKIIDFLSDQKAASEKDIADALKMPLNTIEYNLKKLVESGLIEKTKNFFWSSRGKKIPTYKISNKSIIISPSRSVSSKLKSIVPVALIGGVVAAIIGFVNKPNVAMSKEDVFLQASAATNEIASNSNLLFSQPSPIWMWFFAGVVFTLILFILLNWRKL